MELPHGIRVQDGEYEVKIKEGWESQTNFTLELIGEVQHPRHPRGIRSTPYYLANVRGTDGITSTGYFTLDHCTQGKDLATVLNQTSKGGNICFMNRYDLARLVRALIKDMMAKNTMYRKQLVTYAGHQDGTSIMILNPKEILKIKDNMIAPISETNFIWLNETSPRRDFERYFASPTSTEPLSQFLDLAFSMFAPKTFGAALIAWSAMYGLNRYSWIIDNLRHFNLPILYGETMVGKTMIAMCAAWMNGCPNTAVVSRCTRSFLRHQITTSAMPFVWDYPRAVHKVCQMATDLNNPVIRVKPSEQPKKPRTGCLVTANFAMTEMVKCLNRLLVLYIPKGKATMKFGDAKVLEDKAWEASTAFPAVMGILDQILPEEVQRECTALYDKFPADKRIVEGLALNKVFTRKVLVVAKRTEYMKYVEDYIDETFITYYHDILYPASL